MTVSRPVGSLDLAAVESRLRTESLGRRLVYLASASSTQEVARGEAESGAASGTVVVAEEQTAGRGRFGREWVSPAGRNLYLTLVLRPSVRGLRALSIVSPLAIAVAVEEVTGLSPRIKWPNDAIIEGRKLAGVLIENELSGDEIRYSLVGIGLNVNMDVERAPGIEEIATSVKRELGAETSREELLAALLNRYEALYQQAATNAGVYEAWRARLDTLGRQVRVTFGDQVYEGLAEDVDTDGNLVLRRPDGERLTLEAGEVSLRA